MGVRSREGLLG
jgi:hypothetical protein